MGGNALKQINTRRVESKKEFMSLWQEIGKRMCPLRYTCSSFGAYEFSHFSHVELVESYRSKKSFGDMDILYTTYDDRPLTKDHIEKIFPETKQIVPNGDVISFEYKDVQIDIIHTKKNAMLYARAYFNFNDLGNIVGKIARKFGLKHGHDGLKLPIRDGDNLVAELLVALDPYETFRFLGLDGERYDLGFETLEEIFEWAVESPFISSDVYQLENLSHIGRVRDKKRKTYQLFLEWLKTYPLDHKVTMDTDKSTHLPEIFYWFPNLEAEYNKTMESIAAHRYMNAKLNGNLVREWTGLNNQPLGLFMKHIRGVQSLNKQRLVLKTDEQIKQMVLKEKERYDAMQTG